MLSKIDKSVWWVVMGICFFIAFVLMISSYGHLQTERMNHSSGETFISVPATMCKYEEHEVVEYDEEENRIRNRYTVYDITYQYEVGGKIYYQTIEDKRTLDTTTSFNCDPTNPNRTSLFLTYDEAADGFNIIIKIGIGFLIVGVLFAIIAIYWMYIYKAPEDVDGIVVRDDFPSFETDAFDVEKVDSIPFPGNTIKKEPFVLYTEDEIDDMNN